MKLLLRALFLSRCVASCAKCRGSKREGSPTLAAIIKISKKVQKSMVPIHLVCPLVFQLCQPLVFSNEMMSKKATTYCMKRSKAKKGALCPGLKEMYHAFSAACTISTKKNPIKLFLVRVKVKPWHLMLKCKYDEYYFAVWFAASCGSASRCSWWENIQFLPPLSGVSQARVTAPPLASDVTGEAKQSWRTACSFKGRQGAIAHLMLAWYILVIWTREGKIP